MLWNYQGKKFLRKPFLLNHQKHFDTNQGVFRKDETKGYLNMNFKKKCYKCWVCVNEPVSYLKIQYSCNYPQPTPTPHPQEVNSLISFYPFTVLWYFLTCGNFLKYQTSFKMVTILVLQFHLKDIFCLQMYTLVTLAHIDKNPVILRKKISYI